MVCGVILLAIILMAIFAPLITQTGYEDQDYLTEALAFPSAAHSGSASTILAAISSPASSMARGSR